MTVYRFRAWYFMLARYSRMPRLARDLLLAVLGISLCTQGAYADALQTVQPLPTQRIISLAPHLTELLYAAGAGEKIVAVVDYSDFPPQALQLPRVGGSANLDVERIVALRPDLVLAWKSGVSPATIADLRARGLRVEASDVARLADIPDLIERIGVLAGTSRAAVAAAHNYRTRLRELEQQHARKSTVRVFYQVTDNALYTLNRDHWVSDAIRVCGGRNVFADLPMLSGQVNVESVLKSDPQVIVASGQEPDWDRWRQRWREWPAMEAVRGGHLYFVPPDLMHRPGPRLLQGVEQLCAALDRVRR